VFDSLLHLIGDPPQAYFIVFGLALGDAVLPVLPSETGVILAGILSTTGSPHLGLQWVILAAALGAFIGDNTCYALGRYGGEPLQKRFFHGERSTRALKWARKQLDARGGLIVVVSRFIPGGRTATTFTCGLTRLRWRLFLMYSALAAILWALYGSLLGYFGGRAFEDRPLLAVAVALGIAFAITLLVEGIRKLRAKSKRT
jgi:membrane protein DedA with SNARE-associated domain